MQFFDVIIVLNRCVLDDSVSNVLTGISGACSGTCPTSGYSSSGSSGDWFTTLAADIWNFQGYIFGFGIGIAAVVALAYLILLRIPGVLFTTIWGLIISILVLLLIGAVLLFDLSVQWSGDGKHSKAESDSLNVFGWIMLVAAGLYVCLMIVLRKRIQLAIAIVKEAARALGSMPVMIFTPVFQVALLCLFLVPWVIYMAYLLTSGTMDVQEVTYVDTNGDTQSYYSRSFTYDTSTNYAFLYMVCTCLHLGIFDITFVLAVIVYCCIDVLLLLDIGIYYRLWTISRCPVCCGLVFLSR